MSLHVFVLSHGFSSKKSVRLSVSRIELVFAGGCCHAAPQEVPVAGGGLPSFGLK